MRNLKRALSLTLASVMLLGMMVVGSSAAAGYDDVADTDNVEAIEVLQAVEVMVGDERGFGPERPVNRAEMAVVMGKLLNLDYNYYEATCPFNDVYDWARGWVGACYANGIVSGRGEGVYDPGTTVTAVEAASMLMRALGYFKYQSDYANGFEVATVSQATKIRLFDGVDSKTNAPLTRNQVAQMVLNALKSGVVEPDGNALNFIDASGNVIATGGKVNYVYTTSNKSFATAISSVNASSMGSYNDAPIVELGEQLYNGDLKLNDTTDVFGRPARQWEYDAKEIGTYVKKELLKQEYTTEVTGKMLYNLLTKPTIDKYDFTISIDGIQCVEANRTTLGEAYFTETNLVNTNTKAVGATDKGVLTQVFVDPDKDNQDVYIAVINTYLAKAVDDYKTNKEEVDFTVWSVENKGSRSDIVLVKNTEDSEVLTVKNEDIFVEDVKEDDIVLVRVAEGEIQEIYDPEVIDNTEISAFKEGSWVNANGTQYDYADSIQYDTEVLDEYDDKNMKDTTYRVFLDMYGYAIGVEIIDDAEDYVFLTGIDLNTSNLYNKTADGNVIHLDGTMETVRINMDDSRNAYNEKFNSNTNKTRVNSLMNTWCTFSVDSKGVYTLTEVANDNYSFLSKFTGDTVKPYTETEKRQNDKLGQGHNSNAVVLDKAHAGLMGIEDNNSGFKTVHANDDSVFLTVKTELITATDVLSTGLNKYPSIIVNDVDSVETGIQNVDLKAYTAQGVIDSDTKYAASKVDPKDVSHGVYTLFKDNGYVVAAVVVGEDDGTSTNYAYITGTVKQESYDKNADEWTWSINAIVNGEQVTLEEKGSTSKYLKSMGKGEWYEVKYKSDGTVRKAEYIASETTQGAHTSSAYIFCEDVTHVTNNGYPKFIGLMEMKEASYDAGNNTIVLYQNLMTEKDGYVINAKGRTLQIDTHRDYLHRDLTVTSNAKVVLVQDTRRVDNQGRPISDKVDVMDRIEDCGEGQNGLKKAVDWLEDNETFYGWVGAIIEDGVATSVIIWDRTAYEINIGGGNRPVSGDATLVWNDVNKDNQYWNLVIPASQYKDNMTTAEIADWLAKAGCSNISKTRIGWNFTRGGMDYTDQAIVVIPRDEVLYNITVADDLTDKTVSADVSRAAQGTTVILTVDVPAGKELDTLTVDNGRVRLNKISNTRYTFTMPAYDVTVKATFKDVEQPGKAVEFQTTGISDEAEWDVLKPDGTILAEADRVAGTEFTLDPAYVLTVKSGADEGEDEGVWIIKGGEPVVIEAQNGGRWMLGMWWGTAPDGKNRPLIDFIDDLSLTRGAYPNWYALAKQGTVFEISVNMGTGVKPVVLTIAADETGVFFDFGEDNDPNADYDKAFDLLGSEANYEMKPVEENREPTKMEPHTYDVEATVGTDGKTVTFKAHFDETGKRTLSDKEIAQALTNINFVTIPEKVNLTTGEIKTEAGIDLTLLAGGKLNHILTHENAKTASDNALYKITWPGNTSGLYLTYVLPTGIEMTQIPDGVKYLIPDSVVQSKVHATKTDYGTVAAAVLPVSSRTVAKGNYVALNDGSVGADINYVEAIAVDQGGILSDTKHINVGNYGVLIAGIRYGSSQISDPGDWGTNQVYVRKGTEIVLTQDTTVTDTQWATSVPSAINLIINGGNPIRLPINKETKKIDFSYLTEHPILIDGVNPITGTPGEFTMNAEYAAAEDVTVYLNGDPTDLGKTNGKVEMDVGTEASLQPSIVYLSKTTDKLKPVKIYTPDGWGQITITKADVDAIITDAVVENNRIDLYTAWEVENAGTDWKMYSDAACTKQIDAKVYYKTGDTTILYVKADNGSTELSWNDSKKWNQENMTKQGNAPYVDTADQGVWSISLKRNIATTDIVNGIKLTSMPKTKVVLNSSGNNCVLSATKGDQFVAILSSSELSLVSLKAIESVTFTKDGVPTTDYKVCDVKDIVNNTAQGRIEIGIWATSNGAVVNKPDTGVVDVGVLTVKLVNGWSFNITVQVGA